jgi:hypothetical protein
MSEWKNEDEIKAELRVLTKELRQLREELRGMVTPPKANPARAFLHRQSWPSGAADEPVGFADDSHRRKAQKSQKK